VTGDVTVRRADGTVTVQAAYTPRQRRNILAGRKPDEEPRYGYQAATHVPRRAVGRKPIELRDGYEHGTTRAYKTCGCRCLPCAGAMTVQRNTREATA
jgi:hypothetical protein